MPRLLRPITVTAVSAAALVLTAIPARADQCDYLTGTGWFNTTANQTHRLAKASFDVAGGCRDGSPTWGYLDYIDQGNRLHLTWTSITAYISAGTEVVDPKTRRRISTRIICGTGATNLFGDVDFGVVAHDAGEPGIYDVFMIRLRKEGVTVYTTENPHEDFTLGGASRGGGGNIQLYESTSGSFGGSCPAFF
jgi:hypothetical protein